MTHKGITYLNLDSNRVHIVQNWCLLNVFLKLILHCSHLIYYCLKFLSCGRTFYLLHLVFLVCQWKDEGWGMHWWPVRETGSHCCLSSPPQWGHLLHLALKSLWGEGLLLTKLNIPSLASLCHLIPLSTLFPGNSLGFGVTTFSYIHLCWKVWPYLCSPFFAASQMVFFLQILFLLLTFSQVHTLPRGCCVHPPSLLLSTYLSVLF